MALALVEHFDLTKDTAAAVAWSFFNYLKEKTLVNMGRAGHML